MTLALLTMLATAPFSLTPLPASDLAELRGGFALPGGLNVAIAIQTDTRVDGSLLLRTVYRVDQAVPQLVVYAPDPTGSGQPRAEAPAAAAPPLAGMTVTFDRQNGARIGPGSVPVPAIKIVNSEQSSLGEAPQNTLPADFSSGGTVIVPSGRLTLLGNTGGQQVKLQTDQLDVSHLVGNAIGSVIANSGSDRAIDTATTVALDISGATPFNLGSSMLKIDTLVADSVGQMVPR